MFFKQLKQMLKLCDFLSYSANGMRWQVRVALLVHLRLRYLKWAGQWVESFVWMPAHVRGAIGRRIGMLAVLGRYGPKEDGYRNLADPSQAGCPGLA